MNNQSNAKSSATRQITIALAQINMIVGDVPGNTRRVIDTAQRARDQLHAQLVVFPECTLSGYPPEDLLFHKGLRRQVASGLNTLAQELKGVQVLVGYPEYTERGIYNSLTLIGGGKQSVNYRKRHLPNYAVFDEERYFLAGDEAKTIDVGGIKLGLSVCEDIWHAGTLEAAHDIGAEALIITNGSPYEIGSQSRRRALLAERISDCAIPIIYLNLIGGQDELVFDGGSMALDATGKTVFQAPQFEEGVYPLELRAGPDGVEVVPAEICPDLAKAESAYRAIVLGVHDYVINHGFPGVIIGLSGGIDSALTLAIAVDALGADRVQAVMMPSRFTADISIEDAAEQARTMAVQYDVLPIEDIFGSVLDTLAPLFAGLPADTTEENIQARSRGIILMAISNKTGKMLLTTGNKSETAVGYATLYGDMAGGFAPIKDCSKTLVYELARYRNGLGPVIPDRVLAREPSAELSDNQKDSDSLPPYDILDPILEALIEENLSVDEISERGFERAIVGKVLAMVQRNEYKRRQAPPGVRISSRAFGRDWRYPITSGYKAD
ncbi:MAG: NAD+ synthase [Gammaproteobacteria bacterium]|nr:NAD+ synthase [Gammaproteobacteria bacterium]